MRKSGFRSIGVVGVLFIVLFAWMADESFARVGSGGRSFGGSRRSFSSPSSPPLRSVPPPPPGGGMGGSGFGRSMPGAGGTGSSFLRGVGGGLLGGMIGGMLFGRPSYGYGAGGFGGSGIGLIELLLLAGLGYFLYKRFIKNPSGRRSASSANGWDNVMGSPGPPPVPGSGYGNEMTSADPVAEAFRTIRQTEPDFDPERFKEIAQDVFFRIQAAWMRRDLTPVIGLIGDQLRSEYLATMAELKQKGHINKLENIAVRKIEIVDAGVQGNEVYITLLFTANLLDYTVVESNGEIISGSNTEPVKFEERWTFARPLNGTSWKLETVAS